MKRILELLVLPLLVCLPVAALSSCSDDDDTPDVDLSIDVDGATIVDDVVYVVRGETMKVTSLNITNNEQGKTALITSATYFVDGFRLGSTIIPPYAFEITFDDEAALGDHALEVECAVAAEGKALGIAVLYYPVKVVESASDIPAAPASATRAVSSARLH